MLISNITEVASGGNGLRRGAPPESAAGAAGRRAPIDGTLVRVSATGGAGGYFTDLSAAILAGGKGRRMGGRRKGLIPVEGEPLLRRIALLLQGLFAEVLLVAAPEDGSGEDVLPAGVIVTSDRFPGRGPLAGIHAALESASHAGVFCVACDMPFLDRRLIVREAELFRACGCEALVPRVGELIEPLHALYGASLLGRAEAILAGSGDGPGGYSVRALLAQARLRYLDLEDGPRSRRAFLNLNTPRDLAALAESP